MVGDEHGLARWKKEGLDWKKAHPETHEGRYDAEKLRGAAQGGPHNAGTFLESNVHHNSMLHSSSNVRRATSYEREVSNIGRDVMDIKHSRAVYADVGDDASVRYLTKEKKKAEKNLKTTLKKKLEAQGTVLNPRKEAARTKRMERLTGKVKGRNVGE
jgi:hypothetical protein